VEYPEELLILAGGLGTRLRPLNAALPKAMMSLGGAPILHWKLFEARLQGFSKVLLSVGYQSELIEEYISSNNFDDLEIEFVKDRVPAQGTAAAVRQALTMSEGEGICITYGDSLTFCSREQVQSLSQGPNTTITYSRFVSPGSSPNVERLQNGTVVYGNLATNPKHVEHGLLAIRAKDLEQLEISSSLPELLTRLSSQGLLAGIEVFTTYWEIGTPASYHEVAQRFERREHEWFFQELS